MNYRIAKLLAETNYTAAATKTLDINVKDIISRIVIGWRVTKSKYGMDSYPHRDITKIELVDGSEVLHSLNGGENQALCIYDRKQDSMNHGQHTNGNAEYSAYGIDFGRYLGDPFYAFDPSRFTNPQLKVTFNFAVADTGATSGNLEVWAYMFDEKAVNPVGFLSAREIKDFTISAAGVYDYVDLPVDKIFRKLFVQGYASGVEPWKQVIEARLSEDSDKRVPFDWDLEDMHRTQKGEIPMVQEELVGNAQAGGVDHYVTPTDYYGNFAGHAVATDQVVYIGTYMQGGKVTLYASSGNPEVLGIVHGYLPNHVFEFPFGDPLDPADWFDVTRVGSLELRVKTGTATSGNIRTFVQQLRSY